MNGFELNKILGAITGVLAVFLAIHIVAEGVFGHKEHYGEAPALAYSVAVSGGPVEEEAPTPLPVLLAAADVGDGERIFRRCSSCHALNENKTGPLLAGVVGRPLAAVDGFGYSGALQNAGGEWDFERLDAFLENPDSVADGTSMNFKLRDPEQRAAVAVYLNAQSDSPLPLPPIPAEPEAVEGVDAPATEAGAATE